MRTKNSVPNRRVVEVGHEHPLEQVGVGLLAVPQLRDHRRAPDPHRLRVVGPPVHHRCHDRAVVQEHLPDEVAGDLVDHVPPGPRPHQVLEQWQQVGVQPVVVRPVAQQRDRGVPLLAVRHVVPELDDRVLPLGAVDEPVLGQDRPEECPELGCGEAGVGQ
nr:hypothetical protein [Nocardioides exalbidus]